MKAVAITPRSAGSTRMVEIADAPRPKAGEVQVRVLDVGIDGTDFELVAGHFGSGPPGADFLVIGHECLGVIEVAGDGVLLRPGDFVAAMVRRPDNCANCRAGSSDLCTTLQYTERGITGAHGFLTSRYTDRAEFLVVIPPQLRSVGVMLEPLSVAIKAQRHAWALQERMDWRPKTALVTGAGSLGLLATFLLRLRGLDVAVFSREPSDSERAKLVERSGARYLTKVDGQFDFVFEATGSPQVMLTGLAHLAANGAMAVLGVGLKRDPVLVDFSDLTTRMMAHNQVLFGSVNSNRRDFDQGVLDLAAIEERWPGVLAAMVTRREPFEHFAAAFARRETDIKVLIDGPR